ncbi:hypothetical protein VMCG_02744 [Cytospora schulzeri]|uniref:Ubiquitin-like protease family profile domain-containing protein n=1 Tax=Cytospora schulzeri TaxID=448051 RepID=A0A423WZB9_9PEZI|nr:hypothetical protein VMCG_02744 [Valsa malicola]
MMKKLAGGFWFGNKLQGPSTPPVPQSTIAKRTSDAPPTKPPKRQRVEGDANHEVHSVVSSSDAVDQPHLSGSSYRKGPKDSQSLRSSGNRRSSGVEVEELRNIDHRIGLGTKRSRHKPGRQLLDSVDGGPGHSRMTTPSSAYNSKRSLHHIRNELRSDPVQDDEDVTLLKGAPSSGTNGRASSRVSGKPGYTTSTFIVPDASTSSDDELSAPQPAISQPQAAKQNQSVKTGPAKTGRKRSAEGDEDERKRNHAAKRRPIMSSRADMQRTKFSSENAHTQGGHETLSITKAVCGPTYVYPAEENMHGDLPGASNKPCKLVPVITDGNLHFEAVDKVGKAIPELEWLKPKVKSLSRIMSNPNTGVVQITKPLDLTSNLSTGRLLYVDFGISGKAKHFIRLCCEANKTITTGTMPIVDLSNAMQNHHQQIMDHNMKKPPPSSTTRPADDIQLLERKHKAARKPPTALPQLQDQPPGNTAKPKLLRDQMKADDTLRNDAVRSGNEPKQTLTPAQEKQLRDVVDDEYGSGHHQHGHDTAESHPRTPSNLNGGEHEQRSQRSLRSTRANARSPSPVLERWTKNHGDWTQEWKTDLVYERTTVGKGDIERLDEGQLLNDEIIFFYIKYLHKQLEEKDEQLANKVYVFNSFFWDKLKPRKGAINYDGVKNWTAKIDLLSFDYIIVPINENAHWYLAIICNAKGLLHKDEAEPEAEAAVPEGDRGQGQGGTQSMADESLTKIAVDVSHISIDDESVDLTANPPREDDKPSATKNSKSSKKGTGPRKYDPRAPIVITLDSLGGPHSSVVTALKLYICEEIKHKKGVSVNPPSAFGTHAKDIPCQPNFTDCGVYLLGYMQEFMKDPDRFTRRILQAEKREWDVNAPALRNEIRELIFKLQKEFQEREDNKRRQKALANRKQPPKSQTPGTSASKSPSQGAGEQKPRKQSPASVFASGAHSRQEASLRAKGSPLRDVSKEAISGQQSNHKPSPQAADDGQDASLSQSQSSGPDTAGNPMNDSMMVNVDESIERRDMGGVSKPRAMPQQIVNSIEGDGQKQTPAPSWLPVSRQTSQSSHTKTPTPAPAVYEQRLLEPIPSSPELSDTATKKGSVSKGGVSPGRTVDNKRYVKSHHFQNTRPGTGVTRKHGPARAGVIKREGIPSSDTEGDGKKPGRGKPSPTIDLTSE